MTSQPKGTPPWWLRVPLALAAACALTLLLTRRPPLPALLAPIRPTPAEQARETIIALAWLLLALLALKLAWTAVKPPPPTEGEEEPQAAPRPPRPRREPRLLLPASRELVALFAAPAAARPVAATASGDTAPRPAAVPALTVARDAEPPGQERMLRLYGPLAVDGSDGAGLGQRPTRGLIAYLALKRGPASSDELLEALWPGQPPRATRSRFWKASRQAQALLGEALQRRHDGYRLDRQRLPIDSDQAEHLQHGQPSRAQLEQAVALVDGEPLADIDYPWADTERRRLQALRTTTLTRATEARLADGDPHGALATAGRLIELEPLNEHGWRLAMEAEAALGRRQAILDRYQQLSQELDEHLGLHPETETRDTYRRLLGQN